MLHGTCGEIDPSGDGDMHRLCGRETCRSGTGGGNGQNGDTSDPQTLKGNRNDPASKMLRNGEADGTFTTESLKGLAQRCGHVCTNLAFEIARCKWRTQNHREVEIAAKSGSVPLPHVPKNGRVSPRTEDCS